VSTDSLQQDPEASPNFSSRSQLQVLLDVTRTLATEVKLDPLLKAILSEAVRLLDAERATIYIVDHATDELWSRTTTGGDDVEIRLSVQGPGLAAYVARTGQAVNIEDAYADTRFNPDFDRRTGFQTKSLLTMPMLGRLAKVAGVIQVLNKQGGPFTDEDAGLLQAFGYSAGVAIENAQLYERLQAEQRRLIEAETEVRRSLVQDLHDGPAQRLSALAMSCEIVRRLLTTDLQAAERELRAMERSAYQMSGELRTLLFELRPLILEMQGLGPALHLYVDQASKAWELPIELNCPAELDRFDAHVERTIFSIVQEALGNARKHARAKHVVITVIVRDHTMEVEVKDDGIGFDVAATRATYSGRTSFGLLNMQERAARIGATLTMQSEPGAGTTVTMTVPLHPHQG
jgi:signal transduction histidine kinase